MNAVELKTDFYKRFNESSSLLIFDRAAMPCAMMGDILIPYMPSLSCGLSMGVKVMARRINGDVLKIENTQSNICNVIRIGSLSERQNRDESRLEAFIQRITGSDICGAEILYDSNIPPSFDMKIPLKAALMRIVARVNNIDASDEFIARSGADDRNVNYFRASLSAKKGWCTHIDSGKVSHIPFPVTGYKILCLVPPMPGRKKYQRLMDKSYRYAKSVFPHITSAGDISPEMLSELKRHAGSRSISAYLTYAAGECERIKNARTALKACRLKDFAYIVNSSHSAAAELVDIDRETLFIVREARRAGCLCARFNDFGAFAIAEDGKVDYIVKSVSQVFENVFGSLPALCVAN